MDSLLRRASKNRFLKYGAPFLIMLVGGSFGLKQFAELRYSFSKSKKITQEDATALGIQMKEDKSNIDQEYKKLKEFDLDTWANIRGPRPWEDSKAIQQQLRDEQQ